MVPTIYSPLKPMLECTLCETLTKMYWYHYNDTTFLNTAKFPMFRSVYTFKIL